jgi:hypothetical protein
MNVRLQRLTNRAPSGRPPDFRCAKERISGKPPTSRSPRTAPRSIACSASCVGWIDGRANLGSAACRWAGASSRYETDRPRSQARPPHSEVDSEVAGRRQPTRPPGRESLARKTGAAGGELGLRLGELHAPAKLGNSRTLIPAITYVARVKHRGARLHGGYEGFTRERPKERREAQ